MGLAKRIVPTLLCRGRTLVKGERFQSWRSVGVVEQAVRIHQARNVDELVLLDIAATAEGRGPDLGLIEDLTRNCFMPLTVGGGVRRLQDVRDLLNAGADKVCIGTAAGHDLSQIFHIADTVGGQAIVVAIDVMGGKVCINSGQVVTPAEPVQYAITMASLGIGEIMLTSIDDEGTMAGYDLDLIGRVTNAVDVPVIAHGGCSGYEDMVNAINFGASAVAAGALFQFTDATPAGAAEYLAQQGIEVRLPEVA